MSESISILDARGPMYMEQYGQMVRNYAYYLTKKYDVADDIVQEVFMKVLRNIHSFRGECSAKSWLLTITRNAVYDYRKSAFVRKVVPLGEIEPGRHHASAEEEFIQKESVEDAMKIVMKLPIKLRIVLLMHYKFDMKPQEIATALSLPLCTVKSRLHRARQQAAKRLETLK
jgi:RNA polymerase sigma-70 factor (ECF subfamily)